MSQLVLDPKQTASAPIAKSVPITLPAQVREFGHMPDFDLWKPGDLLLFSALCPSRAQRAIVKAQENMGYKSMDARWHHTAVYVGDRYMCEAVANGVRYHSVIDFVPDRKIRVRRDTRLSSQDGFRVAIRALMRLSKPYGYWSVLLAYARSLGTEFGHALSREWRVKRDAVICSQLFHDAYAETTNQILVPNTQTDVMPADLSACDQLSDVQSKWERLPP